MKREKQGIHGVECTQRYSLLFPWHRLMDVGWSINRTVRMELWAGSIFDPSHQLGKGSRSWSWRTRMTRVQDDACRLLPIEERCMHIEDLKKTCTFNKSIIQCQSSLHVHYSRGSAELPCASASRTRSRNRSFIDPKWWHAYVHSVVQLLSQSPFSSIDLPSSIGKA